MIGLGLRMDRRRVHGASVKLPTQVVAAGEVFGAGDGKTKAFKLTYKGRPITAVKTADIYRKDWQGNQRMYATPRTNLYRDSEAFGGNTLSEMALTPGGLSPSGSASLDAVPSIVNVIHHIKNGVVGVVPKIGTIVTASVFAKAAGYNYPRVDFYDTSNHGAYFNLAAGSAGVTSPDITARITPLESAPGCYRCSITYTTTVVENLQNNLWVCAQDGKQNFSGDGKSGVSLWGAQCEYAPAATSYIKTLTSGPVTVTDYVMDETGLVVFAAAPVAGAVLSWGGTGSV